MAPHVYYRRAALRMLLWEYKKAKVAGKPYLEPARLAQALRWNVGVALPEDIQLYLADLVEGKIKKPRGRKPTRWRKSEIGSSPSCSGNSSRACGLNISKPTQTPAVDPPPKPKMRCTTRPRRGSSKSYEVTPISRP